MTGSPRIDEDVKHLHGALQHFVVPEGLPGFLQQFLRRGEIVLEVLDIGGRIVPHRLVGRILRQGRITVSADLREPLKLNLLADIVIVTNRADLVFKQLPHAFVIDVNLDDGLQLALLPELHAADRRCQVADAQEHFHGLVDILEVVFSACHIADRQFFEDVIREGILHGLPAVYDLLIAAERKQGADFLQEIPAAEQLGGAVPGPDEDLLQIPMLAVVIDGIIPGVAGHPEAGLFAVLGQPEHLEGFRIVEENGSEGIVFREGCDRIQLGLVHDIVHFFGADGLGLQLLHPQLAVLFGAGQIGGIDLRLLEVIVRNPVHIVILRERIAIPAGIERGGSGTGEHEHGGADEKFNLFHIVIRFARMNRRSGRANPDDKARCSGSSGEKGHIPARGIRHRTGRSPAG